MFFPWRLTSFPCNVMMSLVYRLASIPHKVMMSLANRMTSIVYKAVTFLPYHRAVADGHIVPHLPLTVKTITSLLTSNYSGGKKSKWKSTHSTSTSGCSTSPGPERLATPTTTIATTTEATTTTSSFSGPGTSENSCSNTSTESSSWTWPLPGAISDAHNGLNPFIWECFRASSRCLVDIGSSREKTR